MLGGENFKKVELIYLSLEITPKTVIYALNYYNSNEEDQDVWYQVYARPMTMRFDHYVLRERRKKLGYSQEDVALAIDTTVRTYQKWESGETTPIQTFHYYALCLYSIHTRLDKKLIIVADFLNKHRCKNYSEGEP